MCQHGVNQPGKATMPIELYRDAKHLRLMFSNLARDEGEAVQSNQFLIVNGDAGAIVDPGGNLAYGELYMGVTRLLPPAQIVALLASHADPDIVASLDRWLTACPAKLYIAGRGDIKRLIDEIEAKRKQFEAARQEIEPGRVALNAVIPLSKRFDEGPFMGGSLFAKTLAKIVDDRGFR